MSTTREATTGATMRIEIVYKMTLLLEGGGVVGEEIPSAATW